MDGSNRVYKPITIAVIMLNKNLLTFDEASKLTGYSRTHFYKHAKKGTFTVIVNDNNTKCIDRSDLVRLDWIPPQTVNDSATDYKPELQSNTSESEAMVEVLKKEVEWLNKTLNDRDKQIEFLQDQVLRITALLPPKHESNQPPTPRKSWIRRLFD